MYLLDVSIRDLKYFCVLFVLFVFLFMLLALLRCYTSIFDGFIEYGLFDSTPSNSKSTFRFVYVLSQFQAALVMAEVKFYLHVKH